MRLEQQCQLHQYFSFSNLFEAEQLTSQRAVSKKPMKHRSLWHSINTPHDRNPAIWLQRSPRSELTLIFRVRRTKTSAFSTSHYSRFCAPLKRALSFGVSPTSIILAPAKSCMMSPEVTIGEMPSSINVPAGTGWTMKENNGMCCTQVPFKFQVSFFPPFTWRWRRSKTPNLHKHQRFRWYQKLVKGQSDKQTSQYLKNCVCWKRLLLSESEVGICFLPLTINHFIICNF